MMLGYTGTSWREIEIQEMEEAGIHVRSSRRSLSAGPGASARSSRSQSRSRRPMKQGPAGAVYAGRQLGRLSSGSECLPFQLQMKRSMSSIPRTDSEFRTPEEIADGRGGRHSSTIRPSTSRIPLAKSPSVPVPQDVVERDSPLPRSQTRQWCFQR